MRAIHICTRRLVLRAALFPQPENGSLPPYASSKEQGYGRCLLLPTPCVPVRRASPSPPCFSQCGDSTQRCCTQGCCILPPSRWWSFCLGPTSGPGGAAMPVCPAARAVPCVRLARFVLLLSARESRRQAVTSCVAMLVIPAYSTGSPAQHTLWIKVRRAIEEHKSAISKKA